VGDLQRRPGRRAGRDADEQAFLGGHAPRGGEGVWPADGDDLVVNPRVEHVGHKARADTLDGMRPLLPAGEHRRVGRLDGHHAHARLARLEHFAHAGDRAARAHARHEDVHLARRVAPDFLGGRAAVHVRIGDVGELLRDEGVPMFGGDAVGRFDGSNHALLAGREDQLRAECAQNLAPLLAHRLRHGDDQVVAALGADHRQGDASVAAGRLDDERIRADVPLAFGGLDHGQADTVFDALGRIGVFELSQDGRRGVLGDAVEAHQRRVADKLGDVGGDVHFL